MIPGARKPASQIVTPSFGRRDRVEAVGSLSFHLTLTECG